MAIAKAFFAKVKKKYKIFLQMLFIHIKRLQCSFIYLSSFKFCFLLQNNENPNEKSF